MTVLIISIYCQWRLVSVRPSQWNKIYSGIGLLEYNSVYSISIKPKYESIFLYTTYSNVLVHLIFVLYTKLQLGVDISDIIIKMVFQQPFWFCFILIEKYK